MDKDRVRGEEARNIKYDYKLDDIKIWFLNFLDSTGLYTKRTLSNYENIMQKIKDYEELFAEGKRLETYNYNQIVEVLKSFRSSSYISLRVYLSIIKSYIEFCMVNNIVESNIDFIRGLDYNNLKTFIDIEANTEKYITEKELYQDIDIVVNAQDQAMILLVFEGVRGKANIDITNLKKSDLDINNHTLIHGEDKRVLNLNKKLESILQDCIDESIYTLKNGMIVSDSVRQFSRDVEILDSDYIIRPNVEYVNKADVAISEGRIEEGQILGILVQKRVLSMMKNILDRQYVTLNSLYMSGVINRAVKYSIKEKGSMLELSEFVEYFKNHEKRNDAYRIYDIYKESYDKFKDGLLYI